MLPFKWIPRRISKVIRCGVSEGIQRNLPQRIFGEKPEEISEGSPSVMSYRIPNEFLKKKIVGAARLWNLP